MMSPQAGWLLLNEIVPRLKAAVPLNVHAVGSEDAAELIQDATALAAKLLHNVELQGKPVTPGNITYYTILKMKSGRRSTGSSRVDVLHVGTQLDGHAESVSMDDDVASEEGECLSLHDALASDSEDPSTIAARNLDWDQFCQPLSPTRQAVLRGLVEGRKLTEVRQDRQVNLGTLQHHRRRLAVTIREFMGPDIMHRIAENPRWKDNLMAQRERTARKQR